MSRPGSISVSVDRLRPGTVCSHPIEDASGILLLGSNTRITTRVIDGLRDRGVHSIEIDPSDLDRLTGNGHPKTATTKGRSSKGESNEPCFSSVWVPNVAVKDLLVDRIDEPLSDKRIETLHKGVAAAKKRFDQLEQIILDHQVHSISGFATISDAYARSMVDDHDQTVGVMGVLSHGNNDLRQRAVCLSVLGMSIAIEMGLDGPATLDVGLAGLLHDVGLMLMPKRFSDQTSSLSDEERWEYSKHPLMVNDCLANLRDISSAVQIAIQQVHEQYDGSGFPRALRGPRIHLYARILNVADAYLQLTSASTNRCAILPHDALGVILHHAARGIFDPQAVHAFLKVETMFPLGSNVELKNGEQATVIRRSPAGYATPIVVDSQGERIAVTESNPIVRPLPSTRVEEMRIPVSRMQTIEWNLAEQTLLI
ncbi:Cyclic di-GMP phosphodiesterase response regulator RpfG [Novipirellula aureliae]|uniref:Cyclic di-GMP phosphodiesterase response regulator RpfG n=1 Tax=Novipirellula aureliae TaxID=2527966 RepID=A0A5C6DZE1_9BACT|nr:HD domain-containing phosphohydrolase [Novipirellula aureliae]TWU41584.1 Cyclic di-GMP phosphodiesterase response regulator RpfG [Novipirellula aureliae]